MTAGDYCFIVNPTAGGGRVGRRWPVLRKALAAADIAFESYISEFAGHSTELARTALTAGYRRFITVGGDGTANSVLNGLLTAGQTGQQDIVLGIVPWGTGNDWAAYHHLSPEIDDCIEVLKGGRTAAQDIGIAHFTDEQGKQAARYFLNCAGTGFDSHLLERMGSTQGSRIRYFWSVLKYFQSYTAKKLDVDLAHQPLSRKTFLLIVGLGSYAGAGMRLTPDAVADDGLFDLTSIDELGTLELLASLPYIYNGNIKSHRATHYRQSDTITISGEADQYFQCDGELVGCLPVRLELLPGVLQVLITP